MVHKGRYFSRTFRFFLFSVYTLPIHSTFLLFQIKLCGICCLASAVLCVVITVTTTVIHMNRLQTLRECVYQGSIQTCTCFAGFFDPTMTHHDGNNNNSSSSSIQCYQLWPFKVRRLCTLKNRIFGEKMRDNFSCG